MKIQPLERDTLIKRINGIQAELAELQELGTQSPEEFSSGYGHKLAEYHLHRTLEGVFHIAMHILSRIPGAHATEYAEAARKLGESGIIDKDFANITLVKMAKYRNRIVHFYAEITAQEYYDIIKNNLDDFDAFLSAVKKVLEHPERFGLETE
jgi:uncharacterized protein YutE (UPF0331/DUF86 family)